MSVRTIACLNHLLILLCIAGCHTVTDGPDAPKGFEIHPGFRMQLVASEPLVLDPVDLEFDERGRAFVLEMPGYPYSDEASRLVLLLDNDQDGIYDERLKVADSLGVASSFMPYRGGFLVASPPHLIWLADTDGDEVLDERRIIMDGFSVGNLQHNFNGLTYGLDNWIYAANGGNNGSPYFVDTPDEKLPLRGEDFRFRMDEQQMERIGESSGGFELAFDDWGNLFETHNLEHVSQLVFPGRYLEDVPVMPDHTLTVISDHEENGLSRIYPIGEQETRVNHPEQSGYFSGACGITFYGGQAFPTGLNDHLFVADVVLNLVHIDMLTVDTSAFKASRVREKAEFIASTDRSFRPVNMATGPDAALYLVDMYRAVIEHPEWIPDEIEANLDLSAGKDRGRIYRIFPKSLSAPKATSLDRHDPQALVNALALENQWIRMTAQRLLVESGNTSATPLLRKAVAVNNHDLTRLHAMWTLEGLGELSNELLLKAMEQSGAGLKINALRLLEPRLTEYPALIDVVLECMNDEHASVRLQAALTTSMLDDHNYFAREKDIREALLRMLKQKQTDRWMAMALSAAAQKQAREFIRTLIESGEVATPAQKSVTLTLARSIGRQKQGMDAHAVLMSLSENSEFAPEVVASVIDALSQGWASGTAAAVSSHAMLPSLERLELREQPLVLHAAGRLRQVAKLSPSAAIQEQLEYARQGITDPALPANDRVALLKLLELADFEQRAPILYLLLDNRQPKILQEEALWQLWRADHPAIADSLIARWDGLGPEARKGASDILLYKSRHHPALLTALETGRIATGEMNFDLERRRTLLWWSEDESIKQRAKALFSDAGIVTRQEALEKMQEALGLVGDVEEGKAIFVDLCSQCHRYGDIGKDVGPVLTEISRKSKATLLHDIVDPNAAVDAKYLNHRIRTTAGTIYTGIVDRETEREITLKMIGGIEVTIPRQEIERFASLGISMMPEGQEEQMGAQGLADLLAFLQQPIK